MRGLWGLLKQQPSQNITQTEGNTVMSGIEIVLLGSAQDAGVPQIGCDCKNCSDVRSGTLPQQYAVSMAIIDHQTKSWWLIDCSPDIKQQYDTARKGAAAGCTLQGVLLTHLHMGHYVGLHQFGQEALNAQKLKVYATPSTCAFLRSNQPWVYLTARGNLEVLELQVDAPVQLSPSVSVTPVEVPHRREFSDTVAFHIQGPTKRAFYCPDIDSWDKWGTDIRQVVEQADVSFLDACFFDPGELGPRRPDAQELPHPTVVDTVERLKGLEGRVVLIHLNHTNPLHQDTPQRQWVLGLGFGVGSQAASWQL